MFLYVATLSQYCEYAPVTFLHKTSWLVLGINLVGLKLLVLVAPIMDRDGLTSLGKFGLEISLGVYKNIQWCDLNCNQLVCLVGLK